MKAKLLSKLRDYFRRINNLPKGLLKSEKRVNYSIEQYNLTLFDAIKNNNPFLVSRFGSAELNWYLNYKILNENVFQRWYSFITFEIDSLDLNKRIINDLTFLPNTLEATSFYINEIDKVIPKIDILGTWLHQENSTLLNFKKEIKNIQLGFLEPYYSDKPWTMALKGKRVLVIHPMMKSIESQYRKRELIFGNRNILPEFHLEVLQAPYFDDPRFGSWKSIMDFYIMEIEKFEFDVAILGCGSWGMPLAGYIKDMGKVAIHLGGATQLLFGIIGERWETQWPEFRALNLVNEYWTRPLVEETPGWAKGYDENSYW